MCIALSISECASYLACLCSICNIRALALGLAPVVALSRDIALGIVLARALLMLPLLLFLMSMLMLLFLLVLFLLLLLLLLRLILLWLSLSFLLLLSLLLSNPTLCLFIYTNHVTELNLPARSIAVGRRIVRQLNLNS